MPAKHFKKKHMLWIILGLIACGYIGIILLMFLFQEKLLYFPEKDMVFTPKHFQMDYENINFTTKDNTKLHGWFIEAPNPKYVVLFCHGNAGNISHRIDTIASFYKWGLSTFIFDYRGYGKSKGVPNEKGTYQDIQAAWNYLIKQKKLNPKEIIIAGRSLGGSIAAWLACRVKPKMVVLESTFTSLPKLGQQIYPYFPVKYITRLRYNTKKSVKNIKVPILIIHSNTDELIPFNHGRELFKSANAPKEFLKIYGGHGDGFMVSKDIYSKKWKEFISKY